jgi:signal transduction histidine kinase
MTLKILKNNTIRLHITLLMAVASLLSILVVGLFTQITTRENLEKEALSNLTHQVLLQSEIFEAQLQKLTNTTNFLEVCLTHQLVQNPHADSAMLETIKTNLLPLMTGWGQSARPFSMWIVFNAATINGKHTLSFFDANNDGTFDREEQYDISKQNLASDEYLWWTKAVEQGEVWTKPYYWENWNKNLITYSKSIFHQNKHIACIGSDIDFSELQKTWQEIRFYKTGHLILVDKDHNIILNPTSANKNTKDLSSQESLKYLLDKTDQTPSGIIDNKKLSGNRIFVYNKLSNGWLLLASAPKKEILKPLMDSRKIIGLIAIGAIVLSIVIGYALSRFLQAPILNLVDLFDKSAKGELFHRWKNKGISEIDTIGNQFNKFMSQMQQMVIHLNNQQFSLKKALKKANESDELKSAFLGNLSHEIRTPLYAITGFASLLDNPDLDDEERQNFVQIINRNSDKLLKFVDNIMVFSKLEQNQLVLNRSDISIAQLFDDIKLNFQHTYVSNIKTIIWQTDPNAHADNISVDTSLFKITAEAMIDNGWKFTHEGTVKVGYKVENNHFIFYVSDTGIGIQKCHHELIFKKFFKHKDIGDNMLYEGVGMGLSIAKGIAILHKGDIKLQSKPLEGSTFEVWIPLHHQKDNQN